MDSQDGDSLYFTCEFFLIPPFGALCSARIQTLLFIKPGSVRANADPVNHTINGAVDFQYFQ
jgi:hypothetical protein